MTGFVELPWRASRRNEALEYARSLGIPEDERGLFADAAETAFGAAQSVMAGSSRAVRRQMRKRRRELIDSALVANGVPGWVRALVRLGQWVSVVLPAPFNVIVPAVLWMVDEMIDATETVG